MSMNSNTLLSLSKRFPFNFFVILLTRVRKLHIFAEVLHTSPYICNCDIHLRLWSRLSIFGGSKLDILLSESSLIGSFVVFAKGIQISGNVSSLEIKFYSVDAYFRASCTNGAAFCIQFSTASADRISMSTTAVHIVYGFARDNATIRVDPS